MKHVLITGGAGFIGSHLAEALIARDCRVTVVDDESTGTADNLAAVRDHFNFSFVQGSAADKTLVRRWSPTSTRSITWPPPWACS